MSRFTTARERLMQHVQELERREAIKQLASEALKEQFDAAKADGFDVPTLRIVLKLRKMTPDQRRERRALEAIYLANLEMLDGDPLPDEARRRLDPPKEDDPPPAEADAPPAPPDQAPAKPEQQPLIVKDPAEAREEGAAAAQAGKRIYDNPYPAGDPCRAAWDEGWCAQRQSHGMDLPEAYQRRTKSPEKREPGSDDVASDDAKKGAA
jgi:uncharacterized protein (UPF0335 family)